MKTDDLISQLSQDLKPVRPPMNAWAFAALWSFIALLIAGVMLWLVHPRRDLSSVYDQTDFLLQLLSFAGLLFCGLALVSWLSSPARKKVSIFSGAVFLFLLISVLVNLVGAGMISHDEVAEGLSPIGNKCTAITLVVSLLTGFIFVMKARAGAPLNPLLVGLALGIASLGSGGIAITLHCGIANGMHIAFWHFLLPLVTTTAVGLLVGKKLLRW